MNRVGVAPELLHWAFERSRRSSSELQKRFPKLEAWLRGESLPTLKQLEAYARVTHTPIGYLFLKEPPVEQLPIADLRTMGGLDVSRPSPDLLDTLYLCQQRQEWYREEARTAGEPPLEFVGSLDVGIDPVAAGARLRMALEFDVEQRRQLPTWTDALRQFIAQADALGILVMTSSIVGGNTRRRLDPDEFRGFALSDPLAPLVFINGADTKAAQMFTLAHELAHLWLGQSGVSNLHAAATPEHVIERWCNRAAAELLVPAEVMREEFDSSAELTLESSRLARRFKVSTLVVLRRIHDAGWLSRDEFWSAYWEEVNLIRNIPPRSGGDPARNVGARVSKRFARAVIVSVLEGRTSYTESFRLLGVKKLSAFESIADSLGVRM